MLEKEFERHEKKTADMCQCQTQGRSESNPMQRPTDRIDSRLSQTHVESSADGHEERAKAQSIERDVGSYPTAKAMFMACASGANETAAVARAD